MNGNVPFQYQPSLVSSNKEIDLSVGFNLLSENRPEKDIAYTKSINDVPEKVTAKLLEDIKSSNIFTSIHYPAKSDDDVVINGSLDRFKWKLYAKGWVYVPYLGLLLEIVGVPHTRAYGLTTITLEVKNNKTGTVIGKLQKSNEMETEYNIYNFKAGEAGAELAESLRSVGKGIKEGLLTEVDWPDK